MQKSYFYNTLRLRNCEKRRHNCSRTNDGVLPVISSRYVEPHVYRHSAKASVIPKSVVSKLLQARVSTVYNMTDSVAAPAPVAASPTKKSPVKKKAASKVKKSTATHPTTSVMVIAAIKELKEKKGSSLPAIKKYLAANYKVDPAKLAPFIRKFLKAAVANKTIVQTKGTGASGHFKLAATDAKPKKKSAALKKKKPAAKKAKAPGTPKRKKVAAAKKVKPAAGEPVAKKPKKAAPKPKAPKPKKTPKKPAAVKAKKIPAKKPTAAPKKK